MADPGNRNEAIKGREGTSLGLGSLGTNAQKPGSNATALGVNIGSISV